MSWMTDPPDPPVLLFDLLLQQSRQIFAGQAPRPSEMLWARGDVVPIAPAATDGSDAWTCLRCDGRIVETTVGGDRESRVNHNTAVGRWMKVLPAASGLLRPQDPLACPACHGTGQRSGDTCGRGRAAA